MSPVELTVPIRSDIPLSLTSSSMFGVAVGMEMMAKKVMEIEMEMELRPPPPCGAGEDVFQNCFYLSLLSLCPPVSLMPVGTWSYKR